MGTIGQIEDIGDQALDQAREFATRIEERAEDMAGREGTFTRRIEKVTSALPSGVWLALAGGAIVGSLAFKLFGRPKTANFVGEWVPTLLLLGVYNKLVKIHGSERNEI